MATVLVLGGGMNGLATGMLLGRDGHDVTVVDPDPGPAADDPWSTWKRPGVAQFRMLHFALPRWRQELEEALPEVRDELLARGGIRFNWLTAMPSSRRGPKRVGDEAFDTVTARRPVLEAATAAVAARTPGLTVRRGATVVGLTAGTDADLGVPRVTGVRLRSGEVLHADLVVDCTGRRSRVTTWLREAGAAAPLEDVADAALVYHCRHYRAPEGAFPEVRTTLLHHHDSVSVVTLPADNGTWAVGFVGWSGDRALRALVDPSRFEATLARFPLLAHWGVGGSQVQPLTGVTTMSARDQSRRLVRDGEPVATGILLVGDSWGLLSPVSGRGLAVGLVQVRALSQLLREASTDEPAKLSVRFEEVSARTAGPLFETARALHRHRVAELTGDVTGRPYETDDPAWMLTKALLAAVETDADSVRVYGRIASALAPSTEVLADEAVRSRVLALGTGAPRYPETGPDRTELLAALGG